MNSKKQTLTERENKVKVSIYSSIVLSLLMKYHAGMSNFFHCFHFIQQPNKKGRETMAVIPSLSALISYTIVE